MRESSDIQPTVQLLSGFELSVHGQPVSLTPASERLVAFLALLDRSVRRCFVSGSMWPDATSDRANANLRSALWRVPVVDRHPLVDATSTHLRLRADVEVDFHVAVRRATALVQTAGRDASSATLEMLGWDLLPDWYEDWVALERERYRQLRLHALDQACANLIRRQRYGEALVLAMGAVAADPLRESGFRLVVEIHLAEGNLVEALQQYHAYADRLHDELGAEPSPHLRGLLRQHGLDQRAHVRNGHAEKGLARSGSARNGVDRTELDSPSVGRYR
jgi:DNA-binding SARP family transcriptional activator